MSPNECHQTNQNYRRTTTPTMAPPQLQRPIKKKKKRKRSSNNNSNDLLHDVSQFANLTGSSALADQDDNIMMEMMMEMGSSSSTQQSKPQSTGGSKEKGGGSDGDDDDDDESPSSIQLVTKLPSWLTQQRPGFMTHEDIKLWHQDFQRWADNGLYRPSLLPNIDQELARNFKVKELSTMLLKSRTGGKGNDLRMPMFERWLIDSKFEEVSSTSTGFGGDPVLPSKASPYSDASKRLVNELIDSSSSSSNDETNNGLTLEEAQQKVAELCRSCNVTCQELLSSVERYSKQSSLRKGDRIEIETRSDQQQGEEVTSAEHTSSRPKSVTILYARKKWKKPFCFRINGDSLERLRQRFYQVHSTAGSYPKDSITADFSSSLFHPKHKDLAERSFLVFVVSLLLRYSALSGGQLLDDLRGGGMQGAIHSTTFDVLRKHFAPPSSSSSSSSHWLEGFASPFNATLERFGSAFPLDLDWHFGSVGSFWGCSFAAVSGGGHSRGKLPVLEEFCEANPPFSPGLMEGMVTHMMHRLQVAKTNGARLTFVVIVPSVKEQTRSKSKKMKHDRKNAERSNTAVQKAAASSFRAMVDSEFCSQHIKLPAREHGYVEGSQHLRPTQYKQSTYDTSVIILQSPEAAVATKASRTKEAAEKGSLERDIRTAFASRHESELQDRRGM